MAKLARARTLPTTSIAAERPHKRPRRKNHRKLLLKPMGNVLNIRARRAKRQMRMGIKLYQQQNPQQAIRQWRAARRKLK